MSGETDLNTLLSCMSAHLQEGVYVFVTCRPDAVPHCETARMRFEETEGTTLILRRSEAVSLKLDYEFPSRMITLNVHSALDAVGFLAVITTELARHGMGVNPVSGFYHDHLFVPEDRVEDAMRALEKIAKDAATQSKKA